MKYMSNFLDFRFPQTEQTWCGNSIIPPPPHCHGFDDIDNDHGFDDDDDDDLDNDDEVDDEKPGARWAQ